MAQSTEVKQAIAKLVRENGYGVRESTMQEEDFRLFVSMPSGEESIEIFKVKSSSLVCCAAGIVMGADQQKTFYALPEEKRLVFKSILKKVASIEDLDFFELLDEGKDFRVSMRCEFPADEMSEDLFSSTMDRLMSAGHNVEEYWDGFFNSL